MTIRPGCSADVVFGTAIWDHIGIADFTEGLGNHFVSAVVNRANSILVANGLPSLIRCVTLQFGSVHAHLQGNRVDVTLMLRAAEILQTEVDGHRFNVSIINNTAVAILGASRWDGSTSTIVTLGSSTTTPILSDSGSSGSNSKLTSTTETSLIIGGIFVLILCLVVAVVVMYRRENESRIRMENRIHGGHTQEIPQAATTNDFDIVEGVLLNDRKAIKNARASGIYARPSNVDASSTYFDPASMYQRPSYDSGDYFDPSAQGHQLEQPAYFDPASSPRHYFPLDPAEKAASDVRMRQLVDQARRHYYPETTQGASEFGIGQVYTAPNPEMNSSPRPAKWF